MPIRSRIKKQGFTLIEALISILILALIITGITNLITFSVRSTRERTIMECLVNAANSAIEACRSGTNLRSFECGGINIQLTINKNCSSITSPSNVWSANCEEVTVNAKYNNYQHKLTDLVCKFWEG